MLISITPSLVYTAKKCFIIDFLLFFPGKKHSLILYLNNYMAKVLTFINNDRW